VIFYTDVSSTTDPANPTGSPLLETDIRYISPLGADDALFKTIPANVETLAPNPSVTGQIVFGATTPNTTNGLYGIYSNSTPSLTGAKTIVPQTYTNVDQVAVTPDGSTVIFSESDSSANSSIYSVPITGGTPTLIVQNGADPALDATGANIVYDAFDSTSGNEYIFTCKIDGSSQTQLTSGSTAFDALPQYNKASNKIVFQRDVSFQYDTTVGDNANITEIFTMGIDGSGLTQATSSPQTLTDGQLQTGPSFSPDGTQISFYQEPLSPSSSTVNTLSTAPSGPVSGSFVTPTTVKVLQGPTGGTYWTGNAGRATQPWRVLQLRQRRAKLHKKK
jgi:hypothetical protein